MLFSVLFVMVYLLTILFCVTNFKPNYFRQLFYAQLNSDVIARANNAYEVILIRENVLSLPNFLIERTDFASNIKLLHEFIFCIRLSLNKHRPK